MLRRLSANFKKPYEDTHTWGPLLITIGPHCSGKSSFVQSLDEHVKDHVIDDAAELYEKVLLPIALSVWQDKVSGEVVQALKGRIVHDISIIDRLKSQKGSEQVILTMLFAKVITFKEFEEKMSNLLSDTDHDELFIACVKEVFMTKGNVLKTKTIDLFIPESVESATISVSEQMKKDIKTHQGVICWGNSNLNPDFYKDVLRTCAKYQRVVRFVRWGKELPSVPLRELFKRNILQYLKTGRYTESTKIVKFRKYAEFFTTKAGNNTHKDYAALAGYNMDTFGCVTEDTPANRKSSKTHSAHSDVTQWSAWTNTGQVFNVNHGTPPAPAVAVHSAPPSPSLSIPPPVVIPPSPRSSQFATTNTSAAKTPAHGDNSKHFFAADSDHSLLSSGDHSANGTKGIAELMSDIPEVSETGFSRPPPLDISKSQSVSPSAASIPPLGKTSPRESASSNAPSSSPRNSRSGSYTGEKVSPQKHADETNGIRPALTPAASVAGAFLQLFATQHDSAATIAPSATVSASTSASASGKHVDFVQPAVVPESTHHTSQDEREHSHAEVAPAVSTASPEGRKKSMIESLFSHVEEKDAHVEVAPAPVVVPPPHVQNTRQTSILSMFQHVEDPVVEEEEKSVVVQAPAARQSSVLSLFQRVEEEPEEPIPVNEEVTPEVESNAAVFILDSSSAPHVYEHQHAEDHRDLHVSADEKDEDDDHSEGSQPDEIGFSKPEPLVHDHHKVFLQDSVKLAHQHPHTHKDNDTHNDAPSRSSPKPSISFKEYVEEIPMSATNSSSMPTQHRSEASTNEFAPAATQRKSQDANPFSCILPAIFCGM